MANASIGSKKITLSRVTVLLASALSIAFVVALSTHLSVTEEKNRNINRSHIQNQERSEIKENTHQSEVNIADLNDLQLELNFSDRPPKKTSQVSYIKISAKDKVLSTDDPRCCGKKMVAYISNSGKIDLSQTLSFREASTNGDFTIFTTENRKNLNEFEIEVESVFWREDRKKVPTKIFTINGVNTHIADWEISANNKWIAVLTSNLSDDNAPQKLWIVKADGTEQKQLTTPTPNNLTDVTWSKDSLQIYLDSSGRIKTDSDYFYVVNVEDETIIPTQIKNLSGRIRISTNGATNVYTGGGRIFSPNRSHIAYVARTPPQIPNRLPSYAVRIKNIQTGATADLIETPFQLSNLLWSEDGRTLLYSLDKDLGDTNDGIYLLDLSSFSSRQIIASGEKAKLIPKLWIDKDNIIVKEELFDENGENILKTNLLLIDMNGVKKRTIDSSLYID